MELEGWHSLAILSEGCSRSQHPGGSSSPLPTTPAPGGRMPFHGLCGHLHSYAHHARTRAHTKIFKVSLSLYLLVERTPPFRSKACISSTQESYKSFSQANTKQVQGSSDSALMGFVFEPLVCSTAPLFTPSMELLQYSWFKLKCKGKYNVCTGF